jgi:hypothetical protein
LKRLEGKRKRKIANQTLFHLASQLVDR